MPRLLLIADTPWVRNDVEAAIIDPDESVITVSDPRQAVVAAASQTPEAVLIDMQVGSMGGMAITRELHDAMAQGRLARLPVVILLDRSADAFLAKRAGANAWLLKPFTAQELRATVAAVTGPASG